MRSRAASKVGIKLTESLLPIRREVRGACEMRGLDPLYVANEGKTAGDRSAGLRRMMFCAAMQGHSLGAGAAIIGDVVSDHAGVVYAAFAALVANGSWSMLAGETLPRIC
jgi:hydrogenase expression/formation protein HypE